MVELRQQLDHPVPENDGADVRLRREPSGLHDIAYLVLLGRVLRLRPDSLRLHADDRLRSFAVVLRGPKDGWARGKGTW